MKKNKNIVPQFVSKPIRMEKIESTKTIFISTTISSKRTKKRASRSLNKCLSVVSLLLGFIFLFETPFIEMTQFWKASIFDYKSVEFTGTIFPIDKVPNWSTLSDYERTIPYSQIPQSKLIPIPTYDINAMKSGRNYTGGTENQRNTYITYSVPYLGNYELDGSEFSGSHPGIDIKTPLGTPIRAMANGIVYIAEFSAYGSGKHVTIIHRGMPDPQNPSKTTTLVSTYAHLSSYSVKQGQEVKKGQIIGKSGETGNATAPHLHFQIDKEDAPFFPYWPFSWDDVRKAGYTSYFDAVQNGVGQRNALQYTIHPINLVSQFANYVSPTLMASTDPVLVPEPEPEKLPEKIAIEPKPISEPVIKTVVQAETPVVKQTVIKRDRPIKTRIREGDIVFEDIRAYFPDKTQSIRLLINEENLIASTGEIEISTTLRNLTDVTPPILTKDDFKNGIAEIQFKSYSDSAFKFIAKGSFGEIKSKSLRAQIFNDISPNHQYAEAIRDLKSRNIIKGYSDGTFKPEGTLNRAEAVKILLNGNNISMDLKAPKIFSDVPDRTWFTYFVNTAAARKIIKGYADGTFKPENKISRAEFLKVAILTAGFEITETLSSDPYDDIPKDIWFAPYFEFSRTNNLMQSKNGLMFPGKEITRGEASNIIYKLSKLIKR